MAPDNDDDSSAGDEEWGEMQLGSPDLAAPAAPGALVFPVGGKCAFIDTFGAARGGGRSHEGVDITFSNGLHGRVVSSWQAGPEPLWDAQVSSATGVLRAEILPVPTLEHDGEPVPLPRVTTEVAPIEQYGYVDQMRALVDDAAAGRRPLMDAAFGREVLDVVIGAYCSAGRHGESVLLPFGGSRTVTPLEVWHTG